MDKKKQRIKYKSIKERLLSDENIFLSIYLINSYLGGKDNKELLSLNDQQDLLKLYDIFNVEYIKKNYRKGKKKT